MSTTLTIECPACATTFPVDPAKIPAGGARTECTVCHTPFRVDDPAGEAAYEASPDSWDDSGADVVEHSSEAIVAVDEVVTVWDAEAPAEDVEAIPDQGVGEVDAGQAAWEGEEDVDAVWAPESDVEAEELAADVEAAADDFADRDEWGVEAEGEGAEVAESVSEDGLHVLEETQGDADVAFSEMSEPMDGLAGVEDAASGEVEDVPLADGIVTDQWSELVSEETSGFEEAAEADSWGGGADEEGWVVETEDEGVTLSDLDLDVERLDTVEDQVRAAREESGPFGMADSADAAFVTDAEEDLLGGGEVVLPEDALEAEGGVAQVGGDGPAETEVTEEAEAVAADEGAGEGQDAEEVFQFGRRDPHDKARRLARVLVSDMITYNPERHEEALAHNRLKEDFEEEIDKSWAEYVEQVGPEIA
jgi:predicted Zn finger-like uncharacterized protein